MKKSFITSGPDLKSLYSNKWSLGCYSIKNVSSKESPLGGSRKQAIASLMLNELFIEV